jgi:hypothetical protein
VLPQFCRRRAGITRDFCTIEKLIREEATPMLADRFDQPGFSPANHRDHGCQRGCIMLAQLIATVSLVLSIVVMAIAFVSVVRADLL